MKNAKLFLLHFYFTLLFMAKTKKQKTNAKAKKQQTNKIRVLFINTFLAGVFN
jgi:hypothetical protein